MLRPSTLAVAAALCAIPVVAHAASITGATKVNLDADADLEEIVPLTVSDPSGFPQKSLIAYDECGGTQHAFRLGTPQDNADALVQEVDGTTARPEIRVIASSGASGRAGFVLLVRLGSDRDKATACPSPVTLFRYSSTDPSPKPPKGYSVSNFGVRYKSFTAKYPGKEIEITEGLAGRGDAFCCPSKRRVMRFRFDTKRDRYVRYSTTVRALRRR